jgi:hypothetical protein
MNDSFFAVLAFPCHVFLRDQQWRDDSFPCEKWMLQNVARFIEPNNWYLIKE